MQLRSELTLFDVTNLVVGAIIGADIYVASSFGAGLLGPFSLVAWVLAGVIGVIIALNFAQCAAMLPSVGGPYAYAKEVWGSFAGFTVGWSLWLAEWLSLAVFPVAFTQYLMFFTGNLDWFTQALIKTAFVIFLVVTNTIGIKAAGRTNDALTLIKIAPLLFFSAAGLIYICLNPGVAAANLSPFLPADFSGFGTALVLIFWAYAGFEISTIPADEIKNPSATIPRAIVLGITIVTVFYLVTNIVLFGVRPSAQLALDGAPLAAATHAILEPNAMLTLLGTGIVGVGALFSVAGSDESGMIGTSRLGYALAADGLFPSVFAKIHPRFKTPYLGIIIQSVTALVAAIVGSLSLLVASSVFLMSIAYLATSASVFRLRKMNAEPKFRVKGGLVIAGLGVVFSGYLISLCGLTQIGIGLILLLIGIPIYVKYSPKHEITELKEALLSRDMILRRAYRQEETFLAYLLIHIKRAYRRIKKKK